jgi:hypothetical protein
MLNSSPKKEFTDLLALLKNVASSQSNSDNQVQPRRWFVPESFTGDLLNAEELAAAGFKRDELNADYLKLMNDASNPGKTGEFVAIKQQIDYIAAAERAFRYRHATVTRSLIHASARRAGLGSSSVFSDIEKYVTAALAAASNEPKLQAE